MNDWKDKLKYAVKYYFNDCLDNGETPWITDWIAAYDCFCGCYGSELEFDEDEAMKLTKKIWYELYEKYK